MIEYIINIINIVHDIPLLASPFLFPSWLRQTVSTGPVVETSLR